jgi:phosphoribosylformylglycinamidine cyclo-ligase
MSPAKETLSYKDAGVDIDAGDELVRRIKGAVKSTARPEVLGDIGGFGGLFAVPSGYTDPVLVAATDGVGTKLKLALEYDAHDRVGIDLVAMCVNDIIVQGAEPLFFLDYYSTRRLEVDIAERVVAGIANGCKLAGAALIGGETAEHPGMGTAGEYDLAGFSVGVVERADIIDGSTTRTGDVVIGLGSSGVHSNGFSLIRRVLERDPQSAERIVAGARIIDLLLEPTRIYVRSLLQLFATARPKALAHITGGGLTENIPRVLNDGLGVELHSGSWHEQPVFEWLRSSGVNDPEMRRTFNCGIGMVVIAAEAQADNAMEILRSAGEAASPIGTVVPATGQERVSFT